MARFHIGVGGRTGLSHFIIMYLDIFQIDSVLPRRLHKPISSYVFLLNQTPSRQMFSINVNYI